MLRGRIILDNTPYPSSKLYMRLDMLYCVTPDLQAVGPQITLAYAACECDCVPDCLRYLFHLLS